MWKKWGVISTIWAMGSTVGCIDDVEEKVPEGVEQDTGMALNIDFQGGTDVAGFSFSISDCRSGDPVIEETRSLEELIFPGMVPGSSNDSFDEGSRHQFVDYFTILPVGCYDVEAQPINSEEMPSVQCSPVTATEVFVVEQMTTEILLVSQCQSEY